jgi:hypothetical protein
MNSPTRAAARSHDLLRDWAGLAVTQLAWLEGTHTPTLPAVAAELGFPTAAAPDGASWWRERPVRLATGGRVAA